MRRSTGSVKKQSAAGTGAHLDFYLARGCVVVPCQTGTKKLIRGAGEWTAEGSRANRDKLTGNAAMRNGTGGLLVVDVDAKNGGSLDLMAHRFPGSTMTRTIQTVSLGVLIEQHADQKSHRIVVKQRISRRITG